MSEIIWSDGCPNCTGKSYARNAPKTVETLHDVFRDAIKLAFPEVCWYCEGVGRNVFPSTRYLSLLGEQYREHYGVSVETDQEIARYFGVSLEALRDMMGLVPVPTPLSMESLTAAHRSAFSLSALGDDPSALVKTTTIPKEVRKFGMHCQITGHGMGNPRAMLTFSFSVHTYESDSFVLKSRLTQTQVLLRLWADDAEGKRCLLEEAHRKFIHP